MDKILSTRIDEAAIEDLERATRQLRISKKRLIEEAIRLRARAVQGGAAMDGWAETAGAWNREQTAESILANARGQFEKALHRHHQGKRACLHR